MRARRNWIYFALLLCCAAHLAECQQKQHFRKRPSDLQVKQGSTAVLKCEVGNQGGRVQWAKDGFVLGFNRSIPTNERYEMVGEASAGEHHLRIYNATLVDDADFQCQVGPADGHAAIRATGHLTVLMAPTSVTLKGRGREDMLEVTEGEEVTLECLVEAAKPVASVIWYRNDRRIALETREDTQSESHLHRRHNLLSKITVRMSAEDHGTVFSCQAEHPALDLPKVASVRISVLYPPGPPIITGYSVGETISSGDERTLSCASRGGNPPAKVLWFRNGENIDSSDRPFDGGSLNDYKLVANSSDNGAVFTCQVMNKLTDVPLEASVTLDVQFPPDHVQVTGPAIARVGENVTLTCLTENSNPPATISWVVDGQPHRSSGDRREKASAGGWHTISSISVIVPSVDRDMMFTCHATNQNIGTTKVDTYTLSVLRPPQPPVLYGYSEGTGLQENKEQAISCVSRGGNPPAKLQWYRNGQKIPSESHFVGDVSTAEIVLLAQAQDNGAQYRCEAFNSASASPVSVSTTLIVHFPPQDLQVAVAPEKLSAGTSAVLTCRAGASNPAAVITWFRGGYQVPSKVIETAVAANGGTRVTNVLKLNLTAGDDGLDFTCRATNLAMQLDLNETVTLDVRYSPEFLSAPPPSVDIEVGGSITLNFTAHANPSLVTYSWNRLGAPLSKPVMEDARRSPYGMSQSFGHRRFQHDGHDGVVAEGPYLFLRNVQIEHGGDYELEASNQEGVTLAKVHVNVQYPPRIQYTSGLVTVSEGDEATLECTAEGNPLTEAMMLWRRPNYHFSGTRQTFDNKKAALTVLSANKNDTGVFVCEVNNGIGSPSTANVTLIVRSKPQIDRSQLLSRAATDLGLTGVLECIAQGAPEVRFSWRREGDLLSNGAKPEKYDNETSKIGLVTWKSLFFIRNVNEGDYGYYECVAENELGASPFTIQFTPPTIPEPPLALKVLNTTHDSVMLSWVPGFDGGKPQYFRLRYRPKDSSHYQCLDVYQSGVYSQSVAGLDLDTEYYFSIKSYNDMGESEYRGEFVRARTLSEAPPTPVPSSNVGREAGSSHARVPGLWVIIIVLVATALLALNVSAIVCIIRRRRNKRASSPQSKKQHLHSSSSPKGIALSSTSPHLTRSGSDQGSSKSTTNTMYAPSSYNDTVVGETLSSISEKSRESYTQEDSVGEYEEQGHHKHGGSAYLIDQIEPPPEYASQTPSQPSSAAYNPHEDDYAEVLRRNAYNHQLGKVTPRPPSRATHYSASPESHGAYLTYSYTPSPTGIPNGAPSQYHAPNVTLGLHNFPESHAPVGPDIDETTYQALGLDSALPPPMHMMGSMGLEQHSIPSEPSSLTMDPHSITIDHHNALIGSDGLRHNDAPLSTFQPGGRSVNYPPAPPSPPDPSHMEGHLV
ncbi:nephrin isoform X2 [Hyalella azteca]|uniref:Nephrin isoform X2 n=1 Tax=Hyalella azteca TaxID=294128 RepID=A0A8B7PFM3_HYAAZ|nr:nephrin isoform X2 [Hyalella azteca]